MTELSVIGLLAVMALLPVIVAGAVRLVRRAAGRLSPWWERRRTRRRSLRGDDPFRRPIERLTQDLRRLLTELDEIERSNPPAKVARLRAASLAYDGVLVAACRALEVDLPARPPLGPLERLEAEAELARHGLTW